MTQVTRLLSLSEVESLIQQPTRHANFGSLILCTVMEPMELCDLAKKGRISVDLEKCLEDWEIVTKDSPLIVLPVDIDCLVRALFEHSEYETVQGLWRGVVAGGLTSDGLIARIIRRLALRPSAETWWDEELFEEMESWYSG